MPRRKPREAIKAAMWESLLAAAKSYHNHPDSHGMVTIIANDAGVSKATVSEWKNLISYPEDATLRRLATLYGVTAESVSGYTSFAPTGYEKLGPPDELLHRAADLTEMVCSVLLPDGSVDDFVSVMNRAHELLLDGMSDAEARGQLFYEIGVKRKDGQEDNQKNGEEAPQEE
ncbi:helix-turn-helix transcriptional regulator [Halomonas sp. NO4]|uniref:helix-turn-helix domain-containing protein n=1 Tax=Halomonas sp. NO4 TaxID=2484813 RepID=UPI0013D06139|nr:helix-turn-helix transcriptional regulator [Halomonas sp. NO4]